jgi:hypothetical protein
MTRRSLRPRGTATFPARRQTMPRGGVCSDVWQVALSCALVRMSSQPTPEPIELPEIPPEARAELDALKQRILAGELGL